MKFTELSGDVAGFDRTGAHVQAGEQRSRSVPDVLEVLPDGTAGPDGGSWMLAELGLDFGLLVDRQHDGVLRRGSAM
ncbi:MAG: hypothetical protein M0004_10985 [Actinomycetota bacterium]|nr:hypothetical protein [Actinomycetota bacterium]